MRGLTELLIQLTQIHAVSGYEDDMTHFMYQQMTQMADEVFVDKMGSVIAIRNGQSKDVPRVMIFAHMDEVGFMIKKVEANGCFRLMSVAGHYKALPAHEVQIRTFEGKLVTGVVAIKSDHLTSEMEWKYATELGELFVYPVNNDQEVKVEVGNTVSFYPRFHQLNDDLISTKSLDNRVGCCVLLEAMRRLKNQELNATIGFVGTVQEEVSCDGALAPAQALGANFAITIDGTVSYDTPDTPPEGEVKCGEGPVITRMLRSKGLNSWTPNPKLALFIEKIAQENQIPFQRDVVYGLMSDAKPLRLGDIPSAVIGIPMRGKHSPAEVVSLKDIEATINLVVALVQRLDDTLDLKRGR